MRSLGGSRSVLALAGKTVLGVLLVALAPVMLLRSEEHTSELQSR